MKEKRPIEIKSLLFKTGKDRTRLTLRFSTTFMLCFLIPSLLKAQMVIENLKGPVTQNEIKAFKNYIKSQTPPPNPWTPSHNSYAFGKAGRMVDAMGMMYEVTGDVGILNRMIFFADAFVAARNDLLAASKGGQRVMWTGQIDKVWCPEAPDSPANKAKYAASETEDVIERIAYCAKEILQTPSIWNTTVPDGNPHGYGTSYLARAKKYIAMCDESNDQYFLKWFVEAGTNLIRPPKNQPNWNALNSNVDAINRQMMFTGGYQRLAECHEILNDAPSRVAKYDAIVKASTNECLKGMKSMDPKQVNGKTVYNWSYYPYSTTGSETVGHAAYDVLGIYRAFNRKVYGISLSDVTPFANTVVYVISKGNNTFSGTVRGSGTAQNYMLGEWIPLADWNPTVYDLIATANVAAGRHESDAHITASILWVKNRLYSTPSSNIALNKTAIASNVYNNDAAYVASKAVDGSYTTRWATNDNTTTAWIEVDLGGTYTFSKTVTREFSARVASYKVQYWNGSAWLDAFTGTTIGTTDKTDNFAALTGTKVRLNILSITGTKGPTIYEFAVYGSQAKSAFETSAVTVPPAPEISLLPNPFTKSAKIKYKVAETTNVSITICNINGNVTETLVNTRQEAGEYSLDWNTSGKVPCIYLVIIKTGNTSKTLKLAVIN